jgi:nitrogen regulatory protein P-II 1
MWHGRQVAQEYSMKRIEAIIKPSRLEQVKTAMHQIGVQGLTAWEVKGFGRQGGHREVYRGSQHEVDFVPKTMVLVVVPDEMAEQVADALAAAARTDKIGDGKIFVSTLDEVIRIRTGEVGAGAI